MATTLLVAEPDPLQRQLIDVLLAEDRYELTFVGSGREALSYLKESTPSLALLNVELPDVTGPEICEKMKRVTRLANVPVVLVAAARDARGIDPTTRELARLVGAELLLQKPLGDKNLRGRLARLLDEGAEPSQPARTPGFGTEILEETLADIKGEARRKELERENDRLQRRIEILTSELEALQEENASAGQDADAATLAEQARQIERLTRRNDLLREELEKCKSLNKRRRGLFGGRGGS